jgi:hypothetical protein
VDLRCGDGPRCGARGDGVSMRMRGAGTWRASLQGTRGTEFVPAYDLDPRPPTNDAIFAERAGRCMLRDQGSDETECLVIYEEHSTLDVGACTEVK